MTFHICCPDIQQLKYLPSLSPRQNQTFSTNTWPNKYSEKEFHILTKPFNLNSLLPLIICLNISTQILPKIWLHIQKWETCQPKRLLPTPPAASLPTFRPPPRLPPGRTAALGINSPRTSFYTWLFMVQFNFAIECEVVILDTNKYNF